MDGIVLWKVVFLLMGALSWAGVIGFLLGVSDGTFTVKSRGDAFFLAFLCATVFTALFISL